MENQPEKNEIDLYFRKKMLQCLTSEEETELAKIIESADEKAKKLAKDKLARANFALVVHFAKQKTNKAKALNLSLMDLIEAGSVGLAIAVNGYDWRRGVRFSTYAAWPIKTAIRDALRKQKNGIMKSLDCIVFHDGRKICTGYDLVEDGKTIPPHVSMDKLLLRHLVNKSLQALNGRNREIVEFFFGLKDRNPKKSFGEAGIEIGLTKQAVWYHVRKALRTLRRSENLRDQHVA